MHIIQEEDNFLIEMLSKPERLVHFLPLLIEMLKSAPENFREPVNARVKIQALPK